MGKEAEVPTGIKDAISLPLFFLFFLYQFYREKTGNEVMLDKLCIFYSPPSPIFK